jgi:hypothetical protein
MTPSAKQKLKDRIQQHLDEALERGQCFTVAEIALAVGAELTAVRALAVELAMTEESYLTVLRLWA